MSKFILTYTPIFKKVMIRELAIIDPKIKFVKIFDDSTAMVESSLSREEFINNCLKSKPIFLKHMMPVDEEVELDNTKEADTKKFLEILNDKVALKEKEKFTVQCRIKSGRKLGIEYTAKDIEVALGMNLEKNGAEAVFSDRGLINEEINVVSILVFQKTGYFGYSTSKQNLNFHSDEHRICGREGRTISRAENKLKEALIKFKIELSEGGLALDIGAAPGGWTKVLADYGFDVIAVDPGMLKEELYENKKIKHLKCRIEDLTFNEYFDIIVNDMNVDPEITAEIMNSLASSLKEKGLAIVTYKLPNIGMESINAASSIIEKEYDVLEIKSLFHNRQEVTALLQKKPLVLKK